MSLLTLKICRKQFPFLHSLVSFCIILFRRRTPDCLSPFLSTPPVIATTSWWGWSRWWSWGWWRWRWHLMMTKTSRRCHCRGWWPQEVGDNYIKKPGIGLRTRREVTFVRFMLITPPQWKQTDAWMGWKHSFIFCLLQIVQIHFRLFQNKKLCKYAFNSRHKVEGRHPRMLNLVIRAESPEPEA